MREKQSLITILVFVVAIGLLAGAYLVYQQMQVPGDDIVTKTDYVYVIEPHDYQWVWSAAQRQLVITDQSGQQLLVSLANDNLFALQDWVMVDIASSGDKQLISPDECRYVSLTLPVGTAGEGFRLGSNFDIRCQSKLWDAELVNLL